MQAPNDSDKVNADNAAFAAELRAAIEARGLSLDRVRSHLSARGHDLSIATLSYWQSGRSRPDRASSLAALGSLEEILGVARGSLAAKLPKGRRRPSLRLAPAPPQETLAPLAKGGSSADELTRRLGLAWGDGARRVSSQDVLNFDAERRIVSHQVRELYIATRHGVDRFPAMMSYDNPDVPGYYDGVMNCHRGRTLIDEDEQVTVTELLLDRPLQEGEAILVETAIDQHDSGETEWLRTFTGPVRDSIIEARFHPDAQPTAAWSVITVDGQRKEWPLDRAGGVLTQVLSDFGPGVCGIRWEW